jgi:hypothetical protein
MASTDELLYEKDFGSRPAAALGLGLALAGVAVIAAAILVLPLVALVAVPFSAAGVAGFLRATQHLAVVPGQVTTRSRLGIRTYDATELRLEQREAANVYVLCRGDKRSGIVCVFADDDAEVTREAFANAGVAVIIPDEADALARNGQQR